MAEVSGKKVPLQNESTCESYKDPSSLSEIISGGVTHQNISQNNFKIIKIYEALKNSLFYSKTCGWE